LILTSLAVRVTFEALEKSRGDRNRKTFNIMYSLSFLIVELETARTALLDVFEVSAEGKKERVRKARTWKRCNSWIKSEEPTQSAAVELTYHTSAQKTNLRKAIL